jgi:hypothetical protein
VVDESELDTLPENIPYVIKKRRTFQKIKIPHPRYSFRRQNRLIILIPEVDAINPIQSYVDDTVGDNLQL